jgi:hypothetical protein
MSAVEIADFIQAMISVQRVDAVAPLNTIKDQRGFDPDSLSQPAAGSGLLEVSLLEVPQPNDAIIATLRNDPVINSAMILKTTLVGSVLSVQAFTDTGPAVPGGSFVADIVIVRYPANA